ncbi:phage tail protein [groundwater metagenome]
MSNEEKESKYLQYLPSIYQRGKEDPSAFLGRFLKALEKMLSGRDDGVKVDDESIKGIEEILDSIHYYFDPFNTPSEFLPWLAGWVALTLKEGKDWDEGKKRELVAQIVPLYKKRGTKEGLEEYLKIYVGKGVRIIDELGPFQVGISSKVGIDTVIGELQPYFFIVDVTLPVPDPKAMSEKKKAIEDIIEIEKPAHTYYKTNITVPTMRIGYFSTIGFDTLLWEKS